MSEWPEVELGDHAEQFVGFPFKSTGFVDSPSGAIRLLRGDNVGQGTLRWSGAKHWPFEKCDDLARYHLEADDVILAMDRPWIEAGLKFAYVKPSDLPCLLVQRVTRLRGSSTLDIKFLRYVIASEAFTGHVKAITTGVNVPHISGKDISRFKFRLPPIETQRCIAGILGAYDDLIDVNRRRVAVLEDMARGLFEEWFVCLRFPGHESVPLHNTPDGPLPEGWRQTTVSDAFELGRGKSYRSAELADEGGMPFINLKCLERDGGFRSSGIKRFIGEYKPAHVVEAGDIVMGVTDMTQERRIVGRSARIPLLDEPQAVISMDLVKVLPADGVDKAFLYSWLRFSDFGPVAAQHANGANVLHLKPKDIAQGTVRISVCGRAVDHQAAMALMKRSPKITANCAFAMVHSRGGIFHSFSDRFKIR